MTSDIRQQLYDRIRASSKDEVILEEMIRHGFWPEEEEKPSLPAELIKRRGELQREIAELARQVSAYHDPERAIKEIMKERMRAAREQRLETKKRHAQQRYDRAIKWDQRKRTDIVHLGVDVSASLNGKAANTPRLEKLGLPVFNDMQAIADAMGVALGELRFLAYDRKVAKVSHYVNFRLPKKTGGFRNVSAPMPRLKRLQYWLLDNILTKLDLNEAAHGFCTSRSILTNARPHVGKAVVVNLDLKDFFPSIDYRRVKGLYGSFGYSEAQATLFALLSTEAERTQMELDGEVWNIATGTRLLPQGAPTSPAITNIICRKLDRRLQGAAQKYGFTYTRYADDLTFSADEEHSKALGKLLKLVRLIVENEGFTVNEKKTRIMRKGERQEVTGLTVNRDVGVSRRERRRFRAYLHQHQNNPNPPSWRTGSAKASALGFAQFLQMVHGDKTQKLVAEARRIFKSPDKSKKPGELWRSAMRPKAAKGQAPRENWWQPAEPPRPELEPVESAAKTAKKQNASSSVPPTSSETVPNEDTNRVHAADVATGLRADPKWPAFVWRSALTLVGLILAPRIPGGPLLLIAAIYFLWFWKKK